MYLEAQEELTESIVNDQASASHEPVDSQLSESSASSSTKSTTVSEHH